MKRDWHVSRAATLTPGSRDNVEAPRAIGEQSHTWHDAMQTSSIGLSSIHHLVPEQVPLSIQRKITNTREARDETRVKKQERSPTFTTMSARQAVSPGTTVAPASSYAASEKLALDPAPDSTTTLKPSFVSTRTESGLWATLIQDRSSQVDRHGRGYT